MQRNTNTYGHANTNNTFRNRYNQSVPAPAPAPAPDLFPSLSLGSFPALGSSNAKIHPEKKQTGQFAMLEEVIDTKPTISYSSMASKVIEKPMKKIVEEKEKHVKKSNKIDTKGKKVYMTQQQFLYDGHKYNSEDVIIVDDNGQEIYFSDDDDDDVCNSDSEYEEEEAW
jgi:hypothetical protein